jgi:hypothetical protein
MNLLPNGAPDRAMAPGDQYLVDLGRLVPVAAVNARSAYQIALTSVNMEPEFPAQQPVVYQLDPDGELIAVYD